MLAAVVLSRCVDASLPSPSRVDRPRIIALTASEPAVRPGREVTLRAVWMGLRDDATVRSRWSRCDARAVPDPRRCQEEGLPIDAETPSTAHVVVSEGDWYVVVAACVDAFVVWPAGATHPRCSNGEAAEEVVRRVGASARGTLNRAPSIARLAWVRGEARVELRGTERNVTLPRCGATTCDVWRVEVEAADGDAESMDDGAREVLSASFFATAGTVDPATDALHAGETHTMRSSWALADDVGASEFGVVVRDQRGGEAVRVVSVQRR